MVEESVLLEYVLKAQQGDEQSRQELIDRHKAFLEIITSKSCKRFITWKDDEMSISLIAFNEAIDRYDPSQNKSFYNYTKIIIQSRLIDYFRKEGRQQVAISLDAVARDGIGDEYEMNPMEIKQSLQDYNEKQQIQERMDEIEIYSARLEEFGIYFEELEEASPDRSDARNNLVQIAREFVKYPHLIELLVKTKQLPLMQILNFAQVSRKTVERGRKYLIALIVILMSDDLHHLKSSVAFPDLERGAKS
jgi:RNA polymerase sigma factor